MLARAEALDNAYLRTGGGPGALAGGQLWLRQSDHELDPAGIAIIHSRTVKMKGSSLIAQDVSVFRLDGNDRLLVRLEAQEATRWDGGVWTLTGARRMLPDRLPGSRGDHDLRH